MRAAGIIVGSACGLSLARIVHNVCESHRKMDTLETIYKKVHHITDDPKAKDRVNGLYLMNWQIQHQYRSSSLIHLILYDSPSLKWK